MCIGPLQTWGRRELCMKENRITWMLELFMRLVWLSCSPHACGPALLSPKQREWRDREMNAIEKCHH